MGNPADWIIEPFWLEDVTVAVIRLRLFGLIFSSRLWSYKTF